MKYIGIDPGVHTGFAIWLSHEKRFEVMETINFWLTIEKLEHIEHVERFLPNPERSTVVLENPSVNKPTFHHGQSGRHVREKISQNVGMNKREGQLIEQYCLDNNIKLMLVAPNRKGKLNADSFKQITRWSTQTSQHARDAAMLVFGR